MPNTPIMVRMDAALLAKLDADRGDVNRSEFIRRLVLLNGITDTPTLEPPEPMPATSSTAPAPADAPSRPPPSSSPARTVATTSRPAPPRVTGTATPPKPVHMPVCRCPICQD